MSHFVSVFVYFTHICMSMSMYVSLCLCIVSHSSIYLCRCGVSLDQYSEDQKKVLVDCCPTRVFARDDISQVVTVTNAADCIFCKVQIGLQLYRCISG